jgi:hypothetical protein
MAVRHRSISFSRRNPLLTKVSRSSVFNLAFFHSLAWLGRRVDDNDDSGAEPSASLRVLFLPALVFMLLDRDAFILEVTGVFTHIRSGLHWRWTTAVRIDLIYCAAAAAAAVVEQKGSEADLFGDCYNGE